MGAMPREHAAKRASHFLPDPTALTPARDDSTHTSLSATCGNLIRSAAILFLPAVKEHRTMGAKPNRTPLESYRKEWTESVRTEPIESVKLSDVVIRVAPSGDTAVASYQIDVRTRHAGSKSTDEHAFETDIWFKRQALANRARSLFNEAGQVEGLRLGFRGLHGPPILRRPGPRSRKLQEG